jgi:hypothetical protein
LKKICTTRRRRKATFGIFCKGTAVLKPPTSKEQMVLVRRVTLHLPADNILQRRQGSQRMSQREVKNKATRRTTGANETHNNTMQQNADGHHGFVATSPNQCGRNVSRRTLRFGGIGGQRSTRRKPDSSVRYTDVCSRTAKHQRNMYAGAWQSTSGIFEQLINVSSLGLMLIH